MKCKGLLFLLVLSCCQSLCLSAQDISIEDRRELTKLVDSYERLTAELMQLSLTDSEQLKVWKEKFTILEKSLNEAEAKHSALELHSTDLQGQMNELKLSSESLNSLIDTFDASLKNSEREKKLWRAGAIVSTVLLVIKLML